MKNHSTLYIRYKKKLPALLCALTLIPTLSACAIKTNYREINSLQLVQTLGIDLDEGDQRVQLTVSTGQGLEDQPSVAITRPGDSISSAIAHVQDYSSNEDLFFAHTRFVLLGESAAKELFPEFLDYLARSAKLKLDTAIFVVREDEAKTLLTNDGQKGFNATEGLASIQTVNERTGLAYPFTGVEVISSLSEYGSALVCAVEPAKLEGSVYVEDGGELTAIPSGYAIIKNGRLTGYLDPERSRAATLLLGKPGHGPIALELRENTFVAVLTEQGKAEFTAQWQNGKPQKITVKDELSCGLVELPDNLGYDSESALLSAVSQTLEQKLKEDIAQVLQASRDHASDFLSLRGQLRSKYPDEMSALNTPFPELLPDIEFETEVKCEVTRNYDFEQAQALMKGGRVQ